MHHKWTYTVEYPPEPGGNQVGDVEPWREYWLTAKQEATRKYIEIEETFIPILKSYPGLDLLINPRRLLREFRKNAIDSFNDRKIVDPSLGSLVFTVEIFDEDNLLHLIIKDNGKGFDYLGPSQSCSLDGWKALKVSITKPSWYMSICKFFQPYSVLPSLREARMRQALDSRLGGCGVWLNEMFYTLQKFDKKSRLMVGNYKGGDGGAVIEMTIPYDRTKPDGGLVYKSSDLPSP